MINTPPWLAWAREIQALAQTSTFYAENDYQLQRYRRLNEIAAEIVSLHTNLEYQPVLDAFITPSGYTTPRVDVRGAVFLKDKLLLVRERIDGKWTLPGGWADVGDLPSQAAERELLEEGGFFVRARKVIGIYDANRVGRLDLFHAYKIVFLCDLLKGEAKSSAETSEVRFFGSDELPEDLSIERTQARHIADAFACLNNPNLPTVFD